MGFVIMCLQHVLLQSFNYTIVFSSINKQEFMVCKRIKQRNRNSQTKGEKEKERKEEREGGRDREKSKYINSFPFPFFSLWKITSLSFTPKFTRHIVTLHWMQRPIFASGNQRQEFTRNGNADPRGARPPRFRGASGPPGNRRAEGRTRIPGNERAKGRRGWLVFYFYSVSVPLSWSFLLFFRCSFFYNFLLNTFLMLAAKRHFLFK